MKNKQPSQRQLRVGEQLRHIIAETMQRGHFSAPALQSAHEITVTEVRASPDLKNATAFVISYGQNENMDEIIAALNNETREFQREINSQTTLKFTPRLTFKLDYSFDEAQRIEGLLHEINNNS